MGRIPLKVSYPTKRGNGSGPQTGSSGSSNLDLLRSAYSIMHRGASLLPPRVLPATLREPVKTAVSLANGRTSHRFSLAFRYFTWKKLFNFARIEAQLYMGLRRVQGYPYEWEIDTTNICQLKCPLCHTGLDNVQRIKGVMHFDTFRKTIDEIKDYVVWLSLYSWGEPLLNKQLPRFLSYAHKARIATLISTNLSLRLTPEKAEELIKSGLDVLIISLDGVTQEVYEKYRVRGDLSLVMDNIRLITQKKKELGSRTPYLEWQFIVMKQNEHQMFEARRIAKAVGVDQIIFKKVDFPHGIGTAEMVRKWAPVNSPEFTRVSHLDKPYNENHSKCWRLWRSGVVNWDGGYAPCCYLTDAKDDFGNIKDTSIKSIRNNAHYRTARNLFRNGDTPEVAVGCLTCEVYTESSNGRKHAADFQKVMGISSKKETTKTTTRRT